MLNNVVLIGRLTRDPELRYTGNGVAVANFGLAVERPFTNRQGERDVDFVNITAWRKQAEHVAEYIEKGRLVAVEGRLQIEKYEDKDGIKKNSVAVISNSVKFLDWPKEQKEQKEKSKPSSSDSDYGYSDDVPF